MSGERRRGFATATIGAAGLAAGGRLTHAAGTRIVADALKAGRKAPRFHGATILRSGDTGTKRLYLGGNALLATSSVPFAVGTHDALKRKETTAKRDKDSFLREGARGTADALKQKAESVRTPVPARIRATQAGIGLGAGLGGSALARAALKHHAGAKPYLAPIAGALAGLATLPVSNHAVQRQDRGYVVTPAGVKRAKKPFVKPSSKASTPRREQRSFKQDVGKGWKQVPRLYKVRGEPDKNALVHLELSKDPKHKMVAHGRPMFLAPNGLKHGQMDVRKADLVHWARGESYVAGGLRRTKIVHGGRVGSADDRSHVVVSSPHEVYDHPAITCNHCKNRAYREAHGANDSNAHLTERGRQVIATANERFPHRKGHPNFTGQQLPLFSKREKYLGAKTPYAIQRAQVTAAGSVPGVGPLLQARRSAQFAPPKQKAKAAARQLGYGAAAGAAAGFAGAHVGAAVAGRSSRFSAFAERKHAETQAHPVLRHVVPSLETEGAGKFKSRAFSSKLVEPLVRTKGRAAGAVGAGLLARGIVTGVGNQRAISANQGDQDRYNRRHLIRKADNLAAVAKLAPQQTPKDAHRLARRKRVTARLDTAGGLVGLSALGALATGHTAAATKLSIAGSGIGGTNALLRAKVSRKEAKAIDPVKKAFNLAKASPLPFLHPKAPVFNVGMQAARHQMAGGAGHQTMTGALQHARTMPHGPAAPPDVARRLSGQDFGETVGRLGRALRRQKKEFSATVHPISGRIVDMRRGDVASGSMGGVTARFNRTAHARLAELADRTSNPQIRERAMSTIQGTNPRTMGPSMVHLHNHPQMGLEHRAAPSAQDTATLRNLGRDRVGVLSHRPAPRGQPQTKLVMTRNYDIPDRVAQAHEIPAAQREFLPAEQRDDPNMKRGFMISRAERRFQNQDRATAPKAVIRDMGMTGPGPDAQAFRQARRKALKQAARTSDGRITDYTGYFRAKTGNRKAAEQTGLYSRTTLHKADLPKYAVHASFGKVRVLSQHSKDHFMVVTNRDERRLLHRSTLTFTNRVTKSDWTKREPLKTSVNPDDARKLVERHGLKGPLPKTLDREQRRAAYEARYVSAGGHKAEHWQRRAVAADKVKTGGLAAATAGGAAILATRSPRAAKLAYRAAGKVGVRRLPHAHTVAHHAETAAIAAGTVSGAGELYAGHARRRRSSYASAPAGVAASALRRMQNYDRSPA